jgi:acyl-CoA thioesterase-1
MRVRTKVRTKDQRLALRRLVGGTLLLAAAVACGGDRAPATNGQDGAKDSAPGAAAAGATAENTPPSTIGAPARVVLLGTSLTAGLGLDPDSAFPALLQRRADSAGYRVRIVNAGLSGETSAGALRRASWVLDQPAALVVLEVGANDGLRGVDPDSTFANLVALVKVVQSQRPEAAIALVQMEAPTNLGRSYTTRFHAAYERAAQATGIPLWPFLLDGVAGDARFNQADGIHPNVSGSQRVAATVWQSLEPMLRRLPTARP